MKIFIPFILLLAAVGLQAQNRVISLYDGAAPGSENWNWKEGVSENNLFNTRAVYNVVEPTLTFFPPDPARANGTAAIVAPGGGFYILSINSEGTQVAEWLANKGVAVFVLKYRLAHSLTDDPVKELMTVSQTGGYADSVKKIIPMAIADGKRAITYVRQHAKEYSIDPGKIGIIGFSAGGTVAAAAAFQYTDENKPNFAAPIYPYFPEEMQKDVPKNGPPLFIAGATDDQLGFASACVSLYSNWIKAKNSAAIHMYAKGGHGFGMRVQHLPSDTWIDRLGDWMTTLGFMKQ